jgi:hypothetical protein
MPIWVRANTWLHEGLAQLLEPDSALSYRQFLTGFVDKYGLVPLQKLEASFSDLNARQARVAYLESLLAVEQNCPCHR